MSEVPDPGEARRQAMTERSQSAWQSIHNGDGKHTIQWARKPAGERSVWVGIVRSTSDPSQAIIAMCEGTDHSPQPYTPDGKPAVVLYTPEEWLAFIGVQGEEGGVKGGEFDFYQERALSTDSQQSQNNQT